MKDNREGSMSDSVKGQTDMKPELEQELFLEPGTQPGQFVLAEHSVQYRKKPDGFFTAKDFFTLPEEERVELIDGVYYYMPAPSLAHQELVMFLCEKFRSWIHENGGDCRVYPAPAAVQPDPDDDRTVVMPDVVVICDKSKMHLRYCLGAPDLLVEIVSPSSRQRDYRVKLEKYTRAGVREYWIADPLQERITVYDLAHKKPASLYTFHDKVPAAIWENRMSVDFGELTEELAFLGKLPE